MRYELTRAAPSSISYSFVRPCLCVKLKCFLRAFLPILAMKADLTDPLNIAADASGTDSHVKATATKRLNRVCIVGLVFCGATVLSVTAGLVAYFILRTRDGRSDGGSNDDDAQCFFGADPSSSCVYSRPASDPVRGWTNYTGWTANASMRVQYEDVVSAAYGCCDICDTSPRDSLRAVEPLASDESSHRVSAKYRYDFLLLSTIWLPQWCKALEMGHDASLSHMVGTRCNREAVNFRAAQENSKTKVDGGGSDDGQFVQEPRLTIHGLWPNLFKGYEVCCTDINPNTLSPRGIREAFDKRAGSNYSFVDFTTRWLEPTVPAFISNSNGASNFIPNDCPTCYLHNHEWQKHGTCFSSPDAAADHANDALDYFTAGLQLFDFANAYTNKSSQMVTMGSIASAFDAVAAMNGTIVPFEAIAGLFPVVASIQCDPQDRINETVGNLIELRLCYLPTASGNASFHATGDETAPIITLPNGVQVTPMDCPNDTATVSPFAETCPQLIHIGNY